MWNPNFDVFDVLVFLLASVYVFICPYTKVEESFNMQAMHDIKYHQLNVAKYDHLDYPGVVPRTFLGPIFLTGTILPIETLQSVFFGGNIDKFDSQIKLRILLGLWVVFALSFLRWSITRHFGPSCGKWFMLVTASQFHIMYYMTRTLPNTFALIVATLAIAFWCVQKYALFTWFAGLGIIVFRSELSLLFGIILVMDLLLRKVKLMQVLMHAVPAGIVWLGLTVAVDSFFWKRWLWPEGEVLWYNTILNKSHHWGTLPLTWYFHSAIPRALLFSMFLLPFGIHKDRRSLQFLIPAVAFVAAYSLLPHKELRFIIYTIPMFNVVAAIGCSRLWMNKHKSKLNMLMALGVCGHLLANLLTTSALVRISSYNYPGGVAISHLHDIVTETEKVHVHMDVPVCQTGVTRFIEINSRWRYSKTEDLLPSSPDMFKYTHLLVGVSSPEMKEINPYEKTHTELEVIAGLSTVKPISTYPYFSIILEPKVVILEKLRH